MDNPRKQIWERLKEVDADFVADPFPGTGWSVVNSFEDFELLLDDPDAYMAKHYEISIERYRAWKHYRANPQCRGTTRRGRRCRNDVNCESPQDFVPGISDYCEKHSG